MNVNLLRIVALACLLALPGLSRPAAETGSALTPEQKFFFDTLAQRRSVRAYRSDAVSEEHLRLILDAARQAPTSGNQQPWKFLVVREPARKEALKQACIDLAHARVEASPLDAQAKAEKVKQLQAYYDTCFTAPLFVVVLVDRESKYPDYNHYDGPMAALGLMLAARALGYGTVFYTDTIPEEASRKALQIPERYERVCVTPIGVPLEWPKAPSKRDLSELVVFESFAGK